jgi:hypothetical protein
MSLLMDDEDDLHETTGKRSTARSGPDMEGCSPLIHRYVSMLAAFFSVLIDVLPEFARIITR